jgi:hypothetical protein
MSKLPDPGCVVKVGDGRGFVFEQRISTTGFAKRKPIKGLQLRRFIERRLIFTAAHCLPKLPPAHAAAFNSERTYKLLGSLDGTKENVCAECLFVDPVADIAVLGCPDNQELYEEAEGYEDLTDDAPVVPIGKPRSGKGWILALDGKNWIQTELDLFTGLYGTSLSIGPTEPGMFRLADPERSRSRSRRSGYRQ